MKQFLIFLKGVIVIIVVLSLLITCIGAFSTKDVVFIIAGVISLIVLVPSIIKWMKEHSGSIKTKKEK